MSDIDLMQPHSGRFISESEVTANVVDSSFEGIRAAPILSQCQFLADESITFTDNYYKNGVWWDTIGLKERSMMFWIKTANTVTLTVKFYFNTIPTWGTNANQPIAYSQTASISAVGGSYVCAIVDIPVYAPYLTFDITASDDPGNTTAKVEGYGCG